MSCNIRNCGFVEGQANDKRRWWNLTLEEHHSKVHERRLFGKPKTELRFCKVCNLHYSAKMKPYKHEASDRHKKNLHREVHSSHDDIGEPYSPPSVPVDVSEEPEPDPILETFQPSVDNFSSPFPGPLELIPGCSLASSTAKARYETF